MKRTLLAILLGLLLPLSMMAQDSTTVGADIEVFGADIEVFGTLVGDVAYMFSQETASGSLSENVDGTYTLELDDIVDEITILQIAPPGAITDILTTFSAAWQAAIDASIDAETGEPTLQVAAELQTQEHLVLMLIVGVEYDLNRQMMVYTVELAHVTPNLDGTEFDIAALSSAEDTEFKLESFDTATLTVAGNQDFWDSVSNAAARAIAVRDSANAPAPECDEARDVLENSDGLSSQAIANIEQWIYQNCN